MIFPLIFIIFSCNQLTSPFFHLSKTVSGLEESEAVPNQDLLGDFADRLYAAHGLRGPARSPAPSARQLKAVGPVGRGGKGWGSWNFLVVPGENWGISWGNLAIDGISLMGFHWENWGLDGNGEQHPARWAERLDHT